MTHEFINFNHRIVPAEQACLSAASSAALYGKGIFTTIAVYNSKLFLWEKHWERLTRDAEKIGVDLTEYSEEQIKNSFSELIIKNKIKTARARITFFDESASNIWNIETNKKTTLLITTADFRVVSKDFQLTVSPFRINSSSPLAGIKSCNYLENVLALDEAKSKKFDEAIRLNERGEIASACMANVFWIKNEQIFTPLLETGCLKGTIRSFISETFAIQEKNINLSELFEADEIFLTSSGIGIVKAANLDWKSFNGASELFLKIKEHFRAVSRC